MRGLAVAAVLGLAALAAGSAHAQTRSPKSQFLERCGGCHGLEGKSVSNLVPDLKDQVGYFMCTPDGRAYLGRLPNVAFSQVSDAELAEILNYVVFTVGGSSAPPHAKPYTAAEAGRLRKAPLTATDLIEQRKRIVDDVIARCDAPDSLRDYKRGAAQP
ncbi:cytochrome c [Phenylobacterium sp.]|uniref:c-type cytochrome n=1 Tax=Phenylobacterium sp. TaxID=1871053 RepID=UPI0035B03150